MMNDEMKNNAYRLLTTDYSLPITASCLLLSPKVTSAHKIMYRG